MKQLRACPPPGARAVGALLLLSIPAAAQVVNPAQSQEGPPEEGQEGGWARKRTWELPGETLVIGRAVSPYFEDELVGKYRQPRWTTQRLFPTTRVYVRPAGTLNFEFWTRVKTPREGPTTVETQYELEFGLPHRFQLDLYFVTEKTGGEGELDVSEQKYELRYALADWGVIPTNPTLYVEWVERSAQADKYELKLLLGDQIAPGWHWGSNLVFEHEVGDALESEYSITGGISRTVIDSVLSLGAEVKAALVDDTFDRGNYSEELEIGPSLRWFPLPAFHIDFAPLFGIGPDSRALDMYIVLGWEI